MTRYIRAGPAQTKRTVLAPGDREWAVEKTRRRDGIPLDTDTPAFRGLAGEGAATTWQIPQHSGRC